MKLFKRILTMAGLSLVGGAASAIPVVAWADGSHHQVREIEVIVQGGYQPSRIEVVVGEHVQLRFVRKESGGCTREVVFPTLGIRKELPEGQPVVIYLPELKAGEYEFTCGMNMIKGKIIVRARG
jgi:plastocyanin domain-containing protein